MKPRIDKYHTKNFILFQSIVTDDVNLIMAISCFDLQTDSERMVKLLLNREKLSLK